METDPLDWSTLRIISVDTSLYPTLILFLLILKQRCQQFLGYPIADRSFVSCLFVGVLILERGDIYSVS